MSAADRCGDAQANWYSQFDAQYDALLHLRDEQQQQQWQQQQVETKTPPIGLPSTRPADPLAHAAPHSHSLEGVVARQATPAAVLQQLPKQLRPRSSQSPQRRTRNGGSRRTNSDFPHMQQQQLQHKLSPSLLPVQARHTPNSASGQSIDSGVPAEFQDMMQQQMDSKRRAAQYRQQRAQEKAEQKAAEDARRADHRAKMKAIQLRSPGSPAISASPSPIVTPHSSRPVSRQPRASDAVEVVESAPSSSFSSPSVPPSTKLPASAERSRRPQQPAALQSASIAPLTALAPTADHHDKQPSHHRHESSHDTPPRLRTAGQQPPLTATPISTPSTDSPPVAAPSSSVAPNTSRDSLRSLMRASRRQLQQRQQGSSQAVVEVRVGKPYTPRGSISNGLVRRASCEFDVVFASATASLASSPANTRRATMDKDTAMEWPQ